MKRISQEDMEFHLENLCYEDPDYVVDVLEISSEELIQAFTARALEFITNEFGEDND